MDSQRLENETRNDQRLDQLHAQVSTLRNVQYILTTLAGDTNAFMTQITIEIGHEVKEQNRLLDGMVTCQHREPVGVNFAWYREWISTEREVYFHRP